MRTLQDRAGVVLKINRLEMRSPYEGLLEIGYSRLDDLRRRTIDNIHQRIAPAKCLIFGTEGQELRSGHKLVPPEVWIAHLSASWDRPGTEGFDVQKTELVIAWFQDCESDPFGVLAVYAANLDWAAHADSASYDL